jgi:hypothetical protein
LSAQSGQRVRFDEEEVSFFLPITGTIVDLSGCRRKIFTKNGSHLFADPAQRIVDGTTGDSTGLRYLKDREAKEVATQRSLFCIQLAHGLLQIELQLVNWKIRVRPKSDKWEQIFNVSNLAKGTGNSVLIEGPLV